MGFITVTRSVFALACCALGLSTAVQADTPAGDRARGQKVAYTCLGCHGIPDYRNAYPNYRVPKLGGQHEGYLVSALTEYRGGAIPHAKAALILLTTLPGATWTAVCADSDD